MRPDRLLGAACALLLVAGCAGGRAQEPAAAAGSDQAVREHLARLDEKIARLEGANGPGGSGQGALRQGSSLRIGGAGGETVLERLRRLEGERADLAGRLAGREERLAELTRALDAARGAGRTHEQRADYLARVQDSLVATQQTLAERQEELSAQRARLEASELQRLRSEREYYLLAAAVLRLTSDRPAELAEVQERLRDQAKDLLRSGGGK